MAPTPVPTPAPTPTPAPLALTRYPYLQNVTQTSIVVAWKTNYPTDSVVEYGVSGFDLSVSDSTLGNTHALTLTGLSPQSSYIYRVKGNGTLLTESDTLTTAPTDPAKPFTFVVYGDSGGGTPPQFEVAQQIDDIQPDFLLHIGDVVYSNGEAENFDPRFFIPYQNTLKRAPLYPSIGNHDYQTDQGQPYIDAFYLPTNSSDGSERFYSFDFGNAHFVALEVHANAPSDYLAGSTQQQWLESDLAASSSFWKFVYFHDPPYSSGPHGSNLDARNSLSPLFEKYGVDVVFNGHDHDYERTGPMLDFEAEGKGVVYVVTGGGGNGTYVVGQSDFTAFSESAYHVTKVTITGELLELSAIRSDGSIMDTLTIDRR